MNKKKQSHLHSKLESLPLKKHFPQLIAIS